MPISVVQAAHLSLSLLSCLASVLIISFRCLSCAFLLLPMWIVLQLAERLKDHIPEGPPLFGEDVMSDKPQRFFAAEIIREQIFCSFSQEVKKLYNVLNIHIYIFFFSPICVVGNVFPANGKFLAS